MTADNSYEASLFIEATRNLTIDKRVMELEDMVRVQARELKLLRKGPPSLPAETSADQERIRCLGFLTQWGIQIPSMMVMRHFELIVQAIKDDWTRAQFVAEIERREGLYKRDPKKKEAKAKPSTVDDR